MYGSAAKDELAVYENAAGALMVYEIEPRAYTGMASVPRSTPQGPRWHRDAHPKNAYGLDLHLSPQ